MQDLRHFTNQIGEIGAGFRHAQILFVATEADVFSLLESPRRAEDVAKARDWSARGARMLLDGLVALGLIEKTDGWYRNAEIASVCLVPGREGYQGDIIRHTRDGWDTWARMEECVRTGNGVPREGGGRSPEGLRNFILGMSNIAVLSAQDVLGALDLSRYRRLLDVGGGPGTYSIAFVQAHPEMRATLFDLPEVVEIAREQVEKAGLLERFDFVPGDYKQDTLGSGHDLVFVSNIIHSLSDAGNRALVRKCYDALTTGGTLIIKDFLADDGRTGPPFSLIFALHMLIHTGDGDTYTISEVADWTRAAGFAEGRLVSITPQTRLWVVEKEG